MAYNTNAPNGLVPVNALGNYTDSGKTNEYPITSSYASTLFTGDLVSLSTAGTVIRATATTSALGVFQGCKYLPSPNYSGTVAFPYWPGAPTLVTGSTPVALVIDDPNQVYTIQETSATGGAGTALTQGAVGLNANILYTAGSTNTGISAVSLDNASTSTGTTQNLKIIGLDPAVNNSVGNYANWLVKINNSIFQSGGVRPA